MAHRILSQLGTLKPPLCTVGDTEISPSRFRPITVGDTDFYIKAKKLPLTVRDTAYSFLVENCSASSHRRGSVASNTQLETLQHPLHNWRHFSILYTVGDTSASSTQLGTSLHPLHNWGHFSILYTIWDTAISFS